MELRLSEIQEIAQKVRMQFENKEISKKELIQLYSTYNSEVEAGTFVAEAEKIFPKLNCGLTSVYLQKILGGKVIGGKYGNHSHSFLLLGDRVVDITADQYGGPGVYVGELKYPWVM